MNTQASMRQALHLSAMQEKVEQRSEAYCWYVERAAQSLTQQCAKKAAALPALLVNRPLGAEVAHG